MTKVKRSFLEKLTGARRIEAEDFDEERIVQPKTIFQQQETETYITSLPQRQPERMEIEQEEENYSAPEAEMESDNEGQLTIDVYQTDNDIVIKSTIAGVKPEDLDVSINNDMITIRGERKQDEQVSNENYYYQECYWGGFSRSVILPIDVVADKAEASMKNGILSIRMPKANNARSKKIQVRGF